MASWKEKDFEEQMRSHIDAIYKNIWGEKLEKIERSNRDEDTGKMLFMDKEMAIDTHLKFYDGAVITFQEKTLRHTKLSFNQFTFEYYNDPEKKDEGEWFKLAAQLYFFGYANKQKTGYLKYWVVCIAKLRDELLRKYDIEELERRFLRQNHPPAKANFFAIPFSIIESFPDTILLKKDNTESKPIKHPAMLYKTG